MMFNTDFIETEFTRPLSHYLLMLATLSFIWLPSIFLIRLQTINKIWFIHFLLLCITTTFILFMNADFFGEVIYETDLYIGGASPVIKYTWYEEIIINNLPSWAYEVVNGYVFIGFLGLIISYLLLLILSSNKFKISPKI